jgi:hypothetical protein
MLPAPLERGESLFAFLAASNLAREAKISRDGYAALLAEGPGKAGRGKGDTEGSFPRATSTSAPKIAQPFCRPSASIHTAKKTERLPELLSFYDILDFPAHVRFSKAIFVVWRHFKPSRTLTVNKRETLLKLPYPRAEPPSRSAPSLPPTRQSCKRTRLKTFFSPGRACCAECLKV